MKPSLPAVFLLVAICFAPAIDTAAGEAAESIVIEATPTGFARFAGGSNSFGQIEFKGGLVLTSPDKRFGGLSGLALSADGRDFLAVSDDGWWIRAELQYENGRLTSLSRATLAPILDGTGRRPRTKRRRDAEALALDPPGTLEAAAYVGFESRTRIEKFDIRAKGFSARPVRVRTPDTLAAGPRNGQLEALGHLASGPWKGSLLALSEKNRDAAGNIRGWLIGGTETLPFAVSRHQDYDITDLAVLPDGSVLTLERSYSAEIFPGMALRRFALDGLKKGQVISPELLFAGRQPFYQIDNMEGIAVHTAGDELRITVLSDDNYNRGVQRTVMFQFALRR